LECEDSVELVEEEVAAGVDCLVAGELDVDEGAAAEERLGAIGKVGGREDLGFETG